MGKFCEKCGAQLKEGAAFCGKCGAAAGVWTPNKAEQVQEKKKGKKAAVISIAAAAVLIIAVIVTALYLRSDGYQCKKNMTLAEENFEAEEYKKALSYYKKALELDDTLVEAYVKSADIYVMKESFEDAQKILKKGLKKVEDEEGIDTLNDKLEEVYQVYQAYLEEVDSYLNKENYEQEAIEPKESSEGAVSDSSSGKPIKVGIINNDPNESGYRTANDADLKKTFTAENGYEASFSYSNRHDEQIAFAQTFIQNEVDYLLISAVDTAGWDYTLRDAQRAGVKVILFDRVIDADESLYEASIVSDMALEGQKAVDWLKSQGLSEYNIIHLQGVMGTAAQKGRSAALDAAVSSEGWNLVTQQSAEWYAETAQQIVQSVIDSGQSFNVIYAENDDMARGAVAALDAANISHGVGQDVIIMCFDCNQWALQELLDQNWNYDGQCSPFQASYIDDVIKTLESGGTIANKTIIIDEKGFDATTITADDVRNYGI